MRSWWVTLVTQPSAKCFHDSTFPSPSLLAKCFSRQDIPITQPSAKFLQHGLNNHEHTVLVWRQCPLALSPEPATVEVQGSWGANCGLLLYHTEVRLQRWGSRWCRAAVETLHHESWWETSRQLYKSIMHISLYMEVKFLSWKRKKHNHKKGWLIPFYKQQIYH